MVKSVQGEAISLLTNGRCADWNLATSVVSKFSPAKANIRRMVAWAEPRKLIISLGYVGRISYK